MLSQLHSVCSHPSPCLFGDVMDMCSEGKAKLQQQLKHKSEVEFTQAWEDIKRGGLADQASCLAHQGSKCKFPTSDLDIRAPPPCQPWSAFGKRARGKSHLMLLVLVWLLWVRAAQPLVIIHENVVGFDSKILTNCWGDLYTMVSFHVSPQQMGFNVRRPRLYCILYLSNKLRVLRPLQDVFQKVCDFVQARSRQRRSCEKPFFVVAGEADLLAEENRVRLLRSLPPLGAPSSDWTYLLTPTQKQRNQDYQDHWLRLKQVEHSAIVVNLTQNPHRRPQLTARDGALPTCCRNCGLLWMPSLHRWLLPMELGAAHGLPVTEALAADAGVDVDPARHSYRPDQIGNAMHLANVGCVTAAVLGCLARK